MEKPNESITKFLFAKKSLYEYLSQKQIQKFCSEFFVSEANSN
jgi:hypothetical protein